MVAPIPKTKAKEIIEFFFELYVSDKDPSEFQARRILREIDSTIQSGVDLGLAWLCKGLYFSYMSDPEQMDSAFKNSIIYGATDANSYFNRASQYQAYGYFDEAMYGYFLNSDEDSYDEMHRILRSTLDLEKYKDYFPDIKHQTNNEKFLENLKNCNLDISDLKICLDILLDILRIKKVRFCLDRYSLYQNEYALYFGIKSENDDIIGEILNDYDDRTGTLDLFEKSRRLNIIMFLHTSSPERISA
ncbi:hypothetical protein MMP66_13280 [Acinetobacter dispersus]|uniref:hypothetical protein n=1 Tax=Acinetobacter dispersus TaxID=70348 RepID=UPI001F4BBE25|nr:hypothetical protein [Acinetobacter dispersus]MCH7395234.1 hypothetical protein [Acinetobacter dispersus]